MKSRSTTPGRALAGLVAMLLVLLAQAGWAQQSPEPSARQADDASPSAAAAQTSPPALDDAAIDLAELKLRLVPLTVDELVPLAEAWQGRAREASQAVIDSLLAFRATEEGAAQEALREERFALMAARDDVFARFGAVLDALEAKGGDPSQVEAMRGYMNAVMSTGRSQVTVQEFADGFIRWLTSPEGGMGIALRLGVIALALFALFLVARVVRAWARRVFDRVPSLSKLLRGFLVMAVYWVTIAFGLMIVLAALGVNIAPLFALVGGASFIIAFALQDTLGNLASGLMIMINRPFDEGDFVNVAGLSGSVTRVSVVSTTIKTPDNQIIIIPNSKVWGDVITNVTASDTRRVDLVFGIGYSDSIDEAQRVLEELVADHPKVLKDPEPVIRVNELADSSVNFIVRPWVETGDYWPVYWDLQRKVKEAFDKRGISIPFPQTDMHVHMVSGSKDE